MKITHGQKKFYISEGMGLFFISIEVKLWLEELLWQAKYIGIKS